VVRKNGESPRQQLKPALRVCVFDCEGRSRDGSLFDRAKERGVCALRNLNDRRFVAAFAVKILMQLEPQLANVDTNRAVFDDAVILRLAKDGAADVVFA
jgi:hypothetical protein